MAYELTEICNPAEPSPQGMVFVPDVYLGSLKGAALEVLLAYCLYAQRRHRAPTMGELIKLTGRGKQAIISAQKVLCNLGLLRALPGILTSKQSIPDSIRWQVWERDNFTCQVCAARRFLTIDHILPESKGGTLELSNLQTLCKSCNSRKGAV